MFASGLNCNDYHAFSRPSKQVVAGYSEVGILSSRYKFVNFGARTGPDRNDEHAFLLFVMEPSRAWPDEPAATSAQKATGLPRS